MIRPLSLLCLMVIFVFTSTIHSQKRSISRKSKSSANQTNDGNRAVIVDERLAVLRSRPSLYSRPIQRMSRGREIFVSESKQADGVTFYRVGIPPNNSGWVQADAIVGTFRRGDDVRLARLVQASEDFDRIQRASIFLKLYPKSQFRPPILLLYGDLLEEVATELSRRATRSLDLNEMAASGAPLHSFYLNYSFLDRYRRLGVVFLFNARTKQYHYDGATWKELVKNFPTSNEAVEAKKRLADLEKKLEK